MREKIQTLLSHLNHGLVEREAVIKAALLAVLAGENILLIGPPGTGKSLIARRIAESLGGAQQGSYFEYLLTKFSTPEEIFGPLSISALKQDVFRRNTAGYLPSVRMGFLDEIFKASSSILNALLTILNERKFHNGALVEDVPLQALIAASNELPTGQDELAALYDRFLVRGFVDYVSAEGLREMLADMGNQPKSTKITPKEIENLKTQALEVSVPDAIRQALVEIWQAHKKAFKEDPREQISDRRLMKCLHLLHFSAATNDRIEVDLSDLRLLGNCLWNHPDNIQKINNLIGNVLSSYESVGDHVEINLGNDFHGWWRVTKINHNTGSSIGVKDSIIDVVSVKSGEHCHVLSTKSGSIKELSVAIGDEIRAGAVIAEIEERFDNHLDLIKSNIWL